MTSKTGAECEGTLGKCAALTGLVVVSNPSSQGVAGRCPGPICCGPFGASTACGARFCRMNLKLIRPPANGRRGDAVFLSMSCLPHRRQSIERRRTVGLVADQKSKIDAHRPGQQEVIGTASGEVQADLAVGLEPNDIRIHPVGSHGALDA
jgi:hypothetical protein